MSDNLSIGKKILAAQPFSILMKSELISIEPGKVELKTPITDEVKQQYGFVHGGVLGYAADNALTFAGASALGVPCVSSEYKINFVRPALGDYLLARAESIYTGRTQSVCRCDIYVVIDGIEKLCATAQGTIVKLAEEKNKPLTHV